MPSAPVVLDTDTLSELSRGNPIIGDRARAYLSEFGRLTITAVTVFERLRGYRAALRAGKPFESQLKAFEALAATCVVLPFDDDAARCAAHIWAGSTRSQRQRLGDLLIAATAASRRITLVTRNTKDFRPFIESSGIDVSLTDWARAAPTRVRR